MSGGLWLTSILPLCSHWITGQVKEKLNEPRSYVVKTSTGSELRRNRIHLKPVSTQEPMTQQSTPDDVLPKPKEPVPSTDTQKDELISKTTEDSLTRTSSGRIVKPPDRLNLFVKSQGYKK